MSSDASRRCTNTDKILCIGAAALDTIASITSFPKPDDKIRSESIFTSGGGNAANTAVTLSRMSSSFLPVSYDVDLLSAIGNDSNGDTIRNELISHGVGVERMQRYPGVSPCCYIMVVSSATGPHQNTRTCIFQPGSADLSIDHIQRKLLGTTMDDDFGHLRGYCAAHFDGRHIEASTYLARRLVMLSIPYSVDVERPRGEGLLELLRDASIVICNSRYCSLTLGVDNEREDEKNPPDEEIVANLRRVVVEQSPQARVCVNTLGSRGSCLIILGEEDTGRNESYSGGAAGEEEHIVLEKHSEFPDSPRVIEKHGALWCDAWKNCNIVDTTGAGDVFQGAFLATLWSHAGVQKQRNRQTYKDEETDESSVAPSPFQIPVEKMTLAHALRIGTRVAALKLNGFGSRVALPIEDKFVDSELRTLIL